MPSLTGAEASAVSAHSRRSSLAGAARRHSLNRPLDTGRSILSRGAPAMRTTLTFAVAVLAGSPGIHPLWLVVRFSQIFAGPEINAPLQRDLI